jgi:hypothetical protein
MKLRTSIQLAALLAAFLLAPASFANVKPKPGVHKVVGYLSLQESSRARLYLNPMSRTRYTINVQNPSTVAKLIDKKNYFGQVEVTFKLYNPGPVSAAGEVQSIKVIKHKRIPAYDGNLKNIGK